MVAQVQSPLIRMAHALGRLDAVEKALEHISGRITGYEQEALDGERVYLRASITDIQEVIDELIVSGVRG